MFAGGPEAIMTFLFRYWDSPQGAWTYEGFARSKTQDPARYLAEKAAQGKEIRPVHPPVIRKVVGDCTRRDKTSR